ncbi:hypothetical protein ACFL3M_01925 [Patescibacteria group bacterium]
MVICVVLMVCSGITSIVSEGKGWKWVNNIALAICMGSFVGTIYYMGMIR